MSNFIKDISNIKLTKIAKENMLDYSNIRKETAKKEDIEKFEKELKKKILISLIKENLNPTENIALLDIRDFFNFSEKGSEIYTMDQTTFNSVYILYKLFKE